MKKFCCQAATVAALILLTAGIALGQDDYVTTSRDGVLDWIKKLSGPGIVSLGGQLTFDLGGSPVRSIRNRNVRLRLALLGGTAIDKDSSVTPNDSDIYMATLQPMIVVPFPRPVGNYLEFGIGVAGHGFLSVLPDSAGGGDDRFVHASFPVLIQAPIRLGSEVVLEFGVGGRVFPPFPNRAFEPVNVTVERSEWEWTWGTFVTIGYLPLRRR